jgi:hypothetical protein
MDENQISTAINKAKRGIEQYLEIMKLFPLVNVANNQDFQKKYNAFYRVRQRKENWYKVYYQFMEDQKGFDITFPRVLRYFQEYLGRYEPSFSSKLVATHNPNLPVWDVHVLSNIGLRAPSYTSPHKFNLAETAYHAIQEWYRSFEQSAEGAMIIRMFDEHISEAKFITNTKKIDFVLWQART